MLKNSYAIDLDYNCYVVNADFAKYVFSEEEINYILENKSFRDKEINGEVILYDHKFLYLAPEDFIDKFRLSKEEKVNLLNDVGNIKISDITSENIRAISFLLHYALMTDYEEAEVVAYTAPMSVCFQRFPLSQRMFYFTEEAQFRRNDVEKTEGDLREKISFDTQDKVAFSAEAKNMLENKSLNNLYDGLGESLGNDNSDISLNQRKYKTDTQTSSAFLCSLFGKKEEENIIPFPKIDTDGDGKNDMDTRIISEQALKLVGEPCDLDPATPALACIDVPATAYKNSGIDMEKIKNDMVKFAKEDPNPYKYTWTGQPNHPEEGEIGTDPASDKDNLLSRVNNWYYYFQDIEKEAKEQGKDKKLLFNGNEPYQAGDIIFVKGSDGQPYHSAIVSRINPETGKPLQIVGADFSRDGSVDAFGNVTDGKVKTYTWEEWVTANNGNEQFEHGGFRPSE